MDEIRDGSTPVAAAESANGNANGQAEKNKYAFGFYFEISFLFYSLRFFFWKRDREQISELFIVHWALHIHLHIVLVVFSNLHWFSSQMSMIKGVTSL